MVLPDALSVVMYKLRYFTAVRPPYAESIIDISVWLLMLFAFRCMCRDTKGLVVLGAVLLAYTILTMDLSYYVSRIVSIIWPPGFWILSTAAYFIVSAGFWVGTRDGEFYVVCSRGVHGFCTRQANYSQM